MSFAILDGLFLENVVVPLGGGRSRGKAPNGQNKLMTELFRSRMMTNLNCCTRNRVRCVRQVDGNHFTEGDTGTDDTQRFDA